MQVTSKVAAWFTTITNKEISQLNEEDVPEKHEEGDEIWLGSFYK